MHSDVMHAKSDQGFAFRYAAATPSPYFPTPGGTMCRAHVLTQARCIAAGLHQPFAKERSIGAIFLWSISGSGTHFLMGSSYYSMVRVCLGLVVVLADGITEEFRLGLPLAPLLLLAVLVEFVEAYERGHSGASPRSVDVTRRRLRWTSRSTASILSDPGSVQQFQFKRTNKRPAQPAAADGGADPDPADPDAAAWIDLEYALGQIIQESMEADEEVVPDGGAEEDGPDHNDDPDDLNDDPGDNESDEAVSDDGPCGEHRGDDDGGTDAASEDDCVAYDHHLGGLSAVDVRTLLASMKETHVANKVSVDSATQTGLRHSVRDIAPKDVSLVLLVRPGTEDDYVGTALVKWKDVVAKTGWIVRINHLCEAIFVIEQFERVVEFRGCELVVFQAPILLSRLGRRSVPDWLSFLRFFADINLYGGPLEKRCLVPGMDCVVCQALVRTGILAGHDLEPVYYACHLCCTVWHDKCFSFAAEALRKPSASIYSLPISCPLCLDADTPDERARPCVACVCVCVKKK